MPFRAAVLTVSDLGARGEREDTSGAVIHEMLTGAQRRSPRTSPCYCRCYPTPSNYYRVRAPSTRRPPDVGRNGEPGAHLMRIDILTLFPGMFKGPFDESIIKRAIDSGVAEIHL